MKGKIIRIRLQLKKARLKIAAYIQTEDNTRLKAFLPARETAALLPRQILMGDNKKAPLKLLDSIQPIITRLATGRTVRIWEHDQVYYRAFLPWNQIIFEDPVDNCTNAASECQRPQPH